MRSLSLKSPASRNGGFTEEGEGVEECCQDQTVRSVPGISFQPQHESSSQKDESTDSMDLGAGWGSREVFHRMVESMG